MTSDNLFWLNSSLILELSVKFESEICHENINKPLDGVYLADLGIDITHSDIGFLQVAFMQENLFFTGLFLWTTLKVPVSTECGSRKLFT